MAISGESRFRDLQERAVALLDVGDALTCVGEYAQAIPYILEGEALAAQLQAVELEKTALYQRLQCLVRLDRWEEGLQLDARMRDMQRRYPREHIGPSCASIALFASIHALRGELDLAVRGREEANAIMTAVAGTFEDWTRVQHY
jgi:ATP/maltotriose-dependent transcriptional regulator MalT